FELADFRAHDEVAMLEHALDGAIDAIAQMQTLLREIDEGHGPVLHSQSSSMDGDRPGVAGESVTNPNLSYVLRSDCGGGASGAQSRQDALACFYHRLYVVVLDNAC